MSNNEKIICPNCENEFDSNYKFCPHCGQANKKLNLSFKYFISEFLSANFNIDSKIFQTLKLLVFSPAKLTKEFFEGKRVRYIQPVRLYLLISLVYFAVLSINTSNQTNYIDLDSTFDNYSSADSLLALDSDINDLGVKYDSTDNTVRLLEDKLKVLNSKEGKVTFIQMLQKNTSLGMFILIPLTALIFFALFHKGTYYIQHLVFSIQLQSAVFLLFTIFNLIEFITEISVFYYIEIALFSLLVFTWVKAYYNRSIAGTIWKILLFFMLYGLVLLLFGTFILGFSFLSL